MVQTEIDKFLCESKVFVRSNGKAVLEKLFSLGFSWISTGSTSVEDNIDGMFLIIDRNKECLCHTHSTRYCSSPYKEISTEDILAIKLEPSYRPFKSTQECFSEMRKHEPFGWIKSVDGDDLVDILSLHGESNRIITTDGPYNLKYAFDLYTFIDDTPFGVEES